MKQVYVRDMLFVKALERRLGRSLSEREFNEEMVHWFDAGKDPEIKPPCIRFRDGHFEDLRIPRLVFPDDLLHALALSIHKAQFYVETNEEIQSADSDSISTETSVDVESDTW